ncbi:hypothetical protein ABEB36_009955 [Hypothenemus hampei]|uniref:Arginyl-tRNA--protein transferase 1 n=1 Tax=Hypothenemus hampei TaxID=57062 RepID=A0ABD1EII8_HYPHA
MSIDIEKVSIAQWYGERERHRCGYCTSSMGNISNGMYTQRLTVQEYKDLIDRGWRRSGKYCYKPAMDQTCCPQYTIKCDAINFVLHKSQKKIIKKFNKYLADGILDKTSSSENIEQTLDTGCSTKHDEFSEKMNINFNHPIIMGINDFEQGEASACDIASSINSDNAEGISNVDSLPINQVETEESKLKTSRKSFKDGVGPNQSKPPCKKAKLLRLERKKEKLLQKGESHQSTNEQSQLPKNLQKFLTEIQDSKHKLRMTLVSMNKHDHDDWDTILETEFKLYTKYQTIVHNDLPSEITMKSFTRFLVHSPLKPESFPPGINGPGYGSFHQQYWIDDNLIAVGVIDILPGCVSSVYFFYDPDYRALTLGTYGSLREIQFVQELQTQICDLRYYYMGFYIHSCQKMRYKGRLEPSYLLCPETYVWIPIEKCLPKLDLKKYSRLNEDVQNIDTDACTSRDLETIKVIYDYQLMTVKDLLGNFRGINQEDFNILGSLVGKKLAHSLIFWIH